MRSSLTYMLFRLTGKDPDAGKDGGQEEKGTTEDEMDGWHCWLSGHKFEQTQGDSEGQGSLVCCSPWEEQRVGHDWAAEKEKQQLEYGVGGLWEGGKPKKKKKEILLKVMADHFLDLIKNYKSTYPRSLTKKIMKKRTPRHIHNQIAEN